MIGCEVRPEFYTYTEPVARKEHPCCECRAPIIKGEKYFRGVGKWDGEIAVSCQHILCMEACMFVRDKIENDCISFGGLMDYWAEYRNFMSSRNADAGRELMRMVVKIRIRERRAKTNAGRM